MGAGSHGSRVTRFVAIVAAAAVALVALPAAGADAGDANRPGAPSPGISLKHVHMLETRDGSRLWEIRAEQVEVDEREGLTILSRGAEPIRIAFFSTQGKATCEANRASLDLKTKDVSLEGAVVVRSEQGMELRTEQLRWIAATRRLHTDQAVTISRGGMVSRGQGMEAETDLERVRIFQNITSQLRPTAPSTGRSRSR